MAGIDDRGRGFRTDQQMPDRLDRVLRRGQADPLQPPAAQCRQPFERQRQMRAALVGRHGVDLVHDHGFGGGQHCAARRGAEQDVERLRRGDDDVRRAAAHALALAGRRVAGAHPGADLHIGQTAFAQSVADARQRRFQVALDVVGQRLQRRDIDHLRLVGEHAFEALAEQRIDRREECRQCLAGPGRGRDQGVPAGLDRRPGLRLCRRRCGKAAGEPRGKRGVKQG